MRLRHPVALVALAASALVFIPGCKRDQQEQPAHPAFDSPPTEAEREKERERLRDAVFQAELDRQSGGARCSEGFELMGAPKPRGSGMWCQKFDPEGRRIEAQRLDGTRWVVVENVDTQNGPESGGRTTLYDTDGTTVARIVERKNYETVHFEEPVPGVESLPGVPRD